MSEQPKQYSEGPWRRVSGEVPLSQFELDGWKDTLDEMYGEKNWEASSSESDADKFDILVSPDHNNLDAELARTADEENWPQFKTEAIVALRAIERANEAQDLQANKAAISTQK